jgi:hypothetical protein
MAIEEMTVRTWRRLGGQRDERVNVQPVLYILSINVLDFESGTVMSLTRVNASQ